MPRYVIDEGALVRNLEILKSVSERAGVRILLAQKAFSCTSVYPLCAKYLAGTTASSLFEAKHGHDNFGGETHVFAPAFIPEEMDELLGLVDHRPHCFQFAAPGCALRRNGAQARRFGWA